MDYIWNALSGSVNYLFTSLGIWSRSGKLVFLGLDNAGKTTLIHMLKSDKLAQAQPTLHPTTQDLNLPGINFQAYDLGGHAQARKVWKMYLPSVDAIVFIVDANDIERIPEAANELYQLLNDETISNVPVLILGNKIDKPKALSEDELAHQLNINRFVNTQRPIKLFMCSVLKRQGYGHAFTWLDQQLS